MAPVPAGAIFLHRLRNTNGERAFCQGTKLSMQSGLPSADRHMIPPLRPPVDQYGTRLSVCAAIALITVCFFFVYDGIAHRAAPTAPSVYQESSRARDYRPGNISDRGSLVPDMTSSAV